MTIPTWTTFVEHADTVKVYVSASGNDSTGDGSIGNPYLTVGRGMTDIRTSKPDWLLLNRGDTFSGEGEVSMRDRGGYSATYPMLIGAYGTGARPKLVDTYLVVSEYQRLQPGAIAVQSLEIDRQNSNLLVSGISASGGGPHFMIEGCYVHHWQTNVSLNSNAQTIGEIVFRGNVIAYGYNNAGGHAQGILFGGANGGKTDSALIEDNFFVHNGWLDGDPTAISTTLNHNVYLNAKCTGVTFRRNWSMQASATGAQCRRGGEIYENAFIENPIGLLFGHNESAYPAEAATGNAYDNVVTEGSNVIGAGSVGSPAVVRGFGISVEATNGGRVYNNLVCHQGTGHYGRGFSIEYEIDGTEIDNNVVYGYDHAKVGGTNPSALYVDPTNAAGFDTPDFHDNDFQNVQTDGYITLTQGTGYGNATYTDNRYWSPDVESGDHFYNAGTLADFATYKSTTGETGTRESVSYPDATRTIFTYSTSVGGAGTMADVVTNVLAQERDSWDEDYTADAFNNYMRAGFGMTQTVTKKTYIITAGGFTYAFTTGS